jgi:putative flippase GtrA
MSRASAGIVERARAYSKTPDFKKVWRYCAVSGISTSCTLALLYLFYRVVGLSPFAANIVATALATVPAYYLNRSWAWGKTGRSHFMREVVPFWVIALISLALSTLAVQFAARQAVNVHSKDVKALILLFANLVTYGVLWVGKFTLFNRLLFKHHEPTLESVSV